MPSIYLDHAATTPLDPALRAELEPFDAELFANPSARHPAGVRAAEALDAARRRLARAFETRAEGVVFTSGGTEANNLALFSATRAAGTRRPKLAGHVLIGPTEHASVRVAAAALAEEGCEVEHLPLSPTGTLDLEAALELVRPDTVLVAQSLVQSEVGSVYPVARLARQVRARAPGALVHVDAVQAVGKLELSLVELGVDTLSVSAHKLHGPKGAGALVCRPGLKLTPLLLGGGQEGGMRAGTQHVAGAVGLGLAVERAEATREAWCAHALELRTAFEQLLAGHADVRTLAPGEDQAASIVALELADVAAEVALHHLEQRGVFVSAGSACQAAKRELNPTYAALGLDPERAKRVLRFSFARSTTLDEVRAGARALIEVLASMTERGLAGPARERAKT